MIVRIVRPLSVLSVLVLGARLAGTAPVAAQDASPSAEPTPVITAPPGETEVTFRFDWIETPGDTAVRAAIDQGYFAQNGIFVNPVVGSGSTDAVTLTGTGQFDMAQASALAVVTGVGNGVPVHAVAVEYQKDPNGMISRPDAPINKPEDLYGKRYCLQQGSSQLYYQAVTAVNNLDASKITNVPIGFDIAPLIQSQCDGLIDFGDGELIEARDALGTEPVFAPLSDWGIETYGTTLIANDQFAADHPDLVKGFVDAYVKGIKWAEENPDAAVAMMQKVYSDADPAGLEKRVRAALTYFLNDYSAANGVGAIDPDRWQTGNNALAKTIGLIPNDLTADQVVNNSFLPNPPVMASPAPAASPAAS
jgi:NitT/TauT family transport system substrate-binding protein